ncbi:MAG: MmcQ/YjbR family DNA-binding protein [Pyrinomonadaceae bacterium]
MTGEEFREMALEFAGTETVPHFERVGFKVVKRRMFATYFEADNTANIFLTPKEQQTFCRMDKKNISPIPNKWGEKGATTFRIENLDASIVREALLSAYSEIVGR